MTLTGTCEAYSGSGEESREDTNHGEKDTSKQKPAEMVFSAYDRLPLQHCVSGEVKSTKSPPKHLIENASPPDPFPDQLPPDIAVLRAYISRNSVEQPSCSGLEALVNTN
jgi:hypothetical protein